MFALDILEITSVLAIPCSFTNAFFYFCNTHYWDLLQKQQNWNWQLLKPMLSYSWPISVQFQIVQRMWRRVWSNCGEPSSCHSAIDTSCMHFRPHVILIRAPKYVLLHSPPAEVVSIYASQSLLRTYTANSARLYYLAGEQWFWLHKGSASLYNDGVGILWSLARASCSCSYVHQTSH